jgi:hypothetical protein
VTEVRSSALDLAQLGAGSPPAWLGSMAVTMGGLRGRSAMWMLASCEATMLGRNAVRMLARGGAHGTHSDGKGGRRGAPPPIRA